MAEPTPPARAGGNVLTRKLGPLPTWGWVVIAAAVVIGLAWFKTRQSQNTAATSTSGSQVPEFVNQTYTTIQPPSAIPPDDDDDKHRRRHPRHKPKKKDDDDDKKHGGGGTGPPVNRGGSPPGYSGGPSMYVGRPGQ